VFVHAGVVGWRGRAILIPGASGVGKSTLVAALLRAGATYYSDDCAVLDPRGLVHPYARPLSLRSADGRCSRHEPSAMGHRSGTPALPIGLVALTHFVPGAAWRPRRVTKGQAVLSLLEHTLCAQRDHEGALAVLQRAVAPALIVKSPRGNADET